MGETETVVLCLTEEELRKLRDPDHLDIPDGISEECECLYEYNPKNEFNILNVNLCCSHCLWRYKNNK